MAHIKCVKFMFVGLDRSEVYQRKMDARDELVVRIFGCCCANKWRWWSPSDQKHASFARELQTALRFAVGLLDIYC